MSPSSATTSSTTPTTCPARRPIPTTSSRIGDALPWNAAIASSWSAPSSHARRVVFHFVRGGRGVIRCIFKESHPAQFRRQKIVVVFPQRIGNLVVIKVLFNRHGRVIVTGAP